MENILKNTRITTKVLIIKKPKYETNKYMVQRIKKLASTVTTIERISK